MREIRKKEILNKTLKLSFAIPNSLQRREKHKLSVALCYNL